MNTIKGIIQQGGKRGAHLDYNDVEKQSVVLYNRHKLQKKKPGYLHYEKVYYEEQFGGPLETNGCLSKGHRVWTLDGVEGVLVPERPVTKVRMIDEIEAGMQQEIGSTANGDSADALAGMLQTLGTSLWQENSGGVAGALDSVLSTQGGANPSETPAPDLMLMLMGSSSAAAHSAVQEADAPVVPKGKSKSRAKPKAFDAQTPTSKLSKGSSPAIEASSPLKQEHAPGEEVQTTPKPSKVYFGKAGRTARDFDKEMAAETAAFTNTVATNQLYWGTAFRTKLKILEALEKDLKTRRKNILHDKTQVVTCCVHLKVLGCMKALIEAAGKYGLQSQDFANTFDIKKSHLALEPVATLQMPQHLERDRALQDGM